MTANETCDVVVIGLGAMGAAALHHCTKAGLKTIGVEQHSVPHAFGSSHGSSRVIRKVYFEDPRYVPVLQRSYELWRELERESGTNLYSQTGCLNIAPRGHPDMATLLAGVTQYALPHEVLTPTELERRFRAFRVSGPRDEAGDDVIGVYEHDGGILQPERCTVAHVEIAVRAGARVHVHERVVDVTRTAPSSQSVEVKTTKRTITAGHVVVSLGPWLPSPSSPLLAAHGIAKTLTSKMHAQRQPQLWFAPPNETFAFGSFPVFIHFGARAGAPAYYGMPVHGGNGVKVCRHGGGARTTPDDVDRTVREADIEDVRSFMRRTLPALAEAPVSRSEVCMYTMTPDAHFVVGNLDERVVVLGGFSGHGFKMACAVGEIAMQLVTRGRSDLDISIFDPARLLR